MHLSSCDIIMSDDNDLDDLFRVSFFVPGPLGAVALSIMSVANAYNSAVIKGSNWSWFKFHNLINRILLLLLLFVASNDIIFGSISQTIMWWITHTVVILPGDAGGEIHRCSSWNALFIYVFTLSRFCQINHQSAWTIRATSLSPGVFMWHVTLSLSITICGLTALIKGSNQALLSLLPAPINKPNSHEIGQALWREEACKHACSLPLTTGHLSHKQRRKTLGKNIWMWEEGGRSEGPADRQDHRQEERQTGVTLQGFVDSCVSVQVRHCPETRGGRLRCLTEPEMQNRGGWWLGFHYQLHMCGLLIFQSPGGVEGLRWS